MTYQLQILGLSIGLVFAGTAAKLTGNDAEPYLHQILELPQIRPSITEHRLHQLDCQHCGISARAETARDRWSSQYGERLAAAVAILSSENYQSHSKVQTLLNRLLELTFLLRV
jgi:hypothetical protein